MPYHEAMSSDGSVNLQRAGAELCARLELAHELWQLHALPGGGAGAEPPEGLPGPDDRTHGAGGSADDGGGVSIRLFALWLLRQRLLPALDARWSALDLPHVAMVGGTNTGKSTLLNLLLDSPVCGMSPTARFTQHPQALYPPGSPLTGGRPDWASFASRFMRFGFCGEHPPAPVADEELIRSYRPGFSAAAWPSDAARDLGSIVVWDLPDFSTQAAQVYMGSVLAGAALADVVVFVVTDESYADARALHLLQALAAAGTRLVLTCNKVDASQTELVRDMQRVLSARAGADAGVYVLPRVVGNGALRFEKLRGHEAVRAWRTAVLQAAAWPVKRAGVGRAAGWVDGQLEDLLAPLAAEASAGEGWEEQVRQRVAAAVDRYDHEYIRTVKNPQFQRALLELMRLLDVPGIGLVFRVLRSAVGGVMQVSLRAVRWAWQRWVQPGQAAPVPVEQQLLEELVSQFRVKLADWARSRAQAEPGGPWVKLAERLEQPQTPALLAGRLTGGLEQYRAGLEEQIRERAASLYRHLQGHPARLNIMRGASAVLQTGAIVAAVKLAPVVPLGYDLLIGAAASGFTGVLVQSGMGQLLGLEEARLQRWQREEFAAMFESAALDATRELLELRATQADLSAARAAWAELSPALRKVAGGQAQGAVG